MIERIALRLGIEDDASYQLRPKDMHNLFIAVFTWAVSALLWGRMILNLF